MQGRLRRAHVVGGIATGLCLAGLVHADTSSLPPLDLQIESRCMGPEDFVRRVGLRSPRLAFRAGTNSTPVAITITPVEEGHVEGTMLVPSATAASMSESRRHVEGSTCEEVADALALIVALMFDPESTGTPTEAATGPAPAAGEPEAPRPAPPTHRAPPPARGERWRWTIGTHGAIAAIDELSIGASLFGEMAMVHRHRTLALRLAFTSYVAEVEDRTHAATLVWTYFTPQLCFLELGTRASSISPCAGMSMGALTSGPTEGVERPRELIRAWLAPQAIVRTRVAMWSRLSLEVEAALAGPRTRDRDGFGAGAAFRVPALLPAMSVGVSMDL